MSIQVYHVDTSSILNNLSWNNPYIWSALLRTLPESSQNAVLNKKHQSDKDRTLVSLLLQYWLPYRVSDIDPNTVEISTTNQGKPFYKAPDRLKALNYNVSHASTKIFIAFRNDNVPVGIDAVHLSQAQDWPAKTISSFSSLFTDSQIGEIRNDKSSYTFLKYWSLKEAAVKATGQGLSDDIGNIEFTPDAAAGNQNLYEVYINDQTDNLKAVSQDLDDFIVSIVSQGEFSVELQPGQSFETYLSKYLSSLISTATDISPKCK